MPGPRKVRLTAALVTLLLFAACDGDTESSQSSSAGPTDPRAAIEDVTRRSLIAENKKDPRALAALWTDKGLEEYDVGSREELTSGKAEGFGEEKVTIVKIAEIQAGDGKGSATVDVLSGVRKVAKPVYRLKYAAIESGGRWLLDGFEFLGSPPPAAGVPIVNINATEYSFNLDKSEAPANVAFKFANTGKEPHEISLFLGPAGTSVQAAKTVLENVDGSELSNLPPGYQVDHIGFNEPGKTVDLTFAEPLAAGEYFLVCYLPAGGFTDEGGPVDPEGAPHVKLGMISKLTVK